jgi:peptidoglycan/LPS O-acetylase OafA/YrhL
MAELATPAVRTSRLIGLDLLRLLAIVLVLGRHMEPTPSDLSQPFKSLCDVWHVNGGVGVDLFFVLSGFLVAGLLFGEYRQRGSFSVSRFYVRRAWKIYPAFYWLIGVTYLYCLFVVGYKPPDRSFYTEVLFLQSYQQGHWNHTWSLAVEEHFYLALPLVLLYFARRKSGAADPFAPIVLLSTAIGCFCLAARVANYFLRSDFSFHTHIFPTHLRVDALFSGVAIAYAYHYHSAWFARAFRPRRYLLIGAGIALVAAEVTLTAFSEPYDYTIGFTQRYLGAAAIVAGVLMCQIPQNRLTLGLATLGTYSYSIYLWHMATMYYAVPQLRDAGISWQLRSAIFLFGAFALGITMAKLVELPSLRLRDFLLPSHVGHSVATPTAAEDMAQVRRAA